MRIPIRTNPTVSKALTVLAALLLLAVPALAQDTAQASDQPAGEFEGEVEVSEVLLDVLVTDDDGRVIVGLGPDDFQVTEDGQPVEITDVTFYSSSVFKEEARLAEQKGLDVDRVPVDRYFILFFHDQRTESTPIVQTQRQQLEAARKARRWVKEEVLPTDWVAVVSYDVRLVINQDFTHDKGEIIEALKDAPIARDTKGGNWPSRVEETDGPSLRLHLPQGKELGKETRTIYDALQVLSEAAGHVQGRKNLLLFSRGFGDLNEFGLYEPDPRYYPDTERGLNDNNVAVYAIDTTPPEVSHTMENAMNQIANQTGGQYYFNFSNFIVPLRQIAEQNTGYYLLSYKATHPAGETGYQDVKVNTTNPRFDVKVREGYVFGDEDPS